MTQRFRQTPRGASYGAYPETERFGPFRVSYAEDRSEMVTDTAFFYSNGSAAYPPAPAALRHVAGVGTSAVVKYGRRLLEILVSIACSITSLGSTLPAVGKCDSLPSSP